MWSLTCRSCCIVLKFSFILPLAMTLVEPPLPIIWFSLSPRPSVTVCSFRTTQDHLLTSLMQWKSRELTTWQFLPFSSGKQSKPLSHPPRKGARRILLSVFTQIPESGPYTDTCCYLIFIRYYLRGKKREVYHKIISLTEPCEQTYVFLIK